MYHSNDSFNNCNPIPVQTWDFLQALFVPQDRIGLRWTETWTENDLKQAKVAHRWWPLLADLPSMWDHLTEQAHYSYSNQFFGVCPRAGVKLYDSACQIPIVRCLWADIDICTVDAGRTRCKHAGLPTPSIVVCSGNGVHLYWLLAQPITVNAFPDPLYARWIKKKKWQATYYLDPDFTVKANRGKLLSATATCIQGRLARIAELLGSDPAVQDLSRILRLPGTLNRKDMRNGRPPTSCELVSLDNTLRYTLEDFPEPAATPGKVSTSRHGHVLVPVLTGEDHIDWMETFLERHQIEVDDTKVGGKWACRWKLTRCPFCLEEDGSAVVTISGEGRFGFTCRHNRCNGREDDKRTWQDFRDHYEAEENAEIESEIDKLFGRNYERG